MLQHHSQMSDFKKLQVALANLCKLSTVTPLNELKGQPSDMSIAGLGSSTVDQVLKYTKYPKYIPSSSTGQVHNFFKKYLSTSSTFISSTSTSTSTHIKICSKVRMDIQSRVNFGWKK